MGNNKLNKVMQGFKKQLLETFHRLVTNDSIMTGYERDTPLQFFTSIDWGELTTLSNM